VDDAGVDLARPVLPGGRVRQAQQVDVRAVVARIAHLATRQERQERKRPGEGHDRVRIGRGRQAVVHHLADKAGDAKKVVGHGPGVGNLWRTGGIVRVIGPTYAALAENARQVDACANVRRAVAPVTGHAQRTRRRLIIAAVVQQRVDRERGIGPGRLEGRGIRAENVEDPVLQRGRPAGCLARTTPVLVLSRLGQRPSVLCEHIAHISAIIEIIAWPVRNLWRECALCDR